MTTLTFTDQTMRTRSRSKGIIRAAFDTIVASQGRQVRRHICSIDLQGSDRFDLSEIERRSLFETVGPERH